MKIIFPRYATDKFHGVYDGGNKFITFLSESLSKKGVEVEIITTQPRGLNKKEVSINGVKYTFIGPFYKKNRFIKINMPYKLLFSYNLSKYLKNYKFDILHNTEMFSYFYIFRKNKKPIVTQGWGLEPFYGPESLSQTGLKKLYVKLFLQYPWLKCLKNSDKIASEGKFQQEMIKALGVEERKIFTLSIGIPLQKIKNYKRNHKKIRIENASENKEITIISVNQLEKDKAVDDIIEAVGIVRKKIQKIKLIIIGAGSLEGKMKHWAKEANIEDIFVHKKNISEKNLYNHYFDADIFVSASIQHDWITSIQEAMGCGLPIISSGQKFLVKEGVNGFVVGNHNPKKIAEKILYLINNKEKLKEMGENSLRLSNKYDYDRITNKAIKEYKKLIISDRMMPKEINRILIK